MTDEEKAPVVTRGQGAGDEADVSHLSPQLTTILTRAASPPCRLCGLPIGERDYAASYPFDSECACGSPFLASVVEELPAPNERWFAEHGERCPGLRVIYKVPRTESIERRLPSRARGVRLA